MNRTGTGRPPVSPARFYRPELDALRFLAFLLIFIHHALRNASLASVIQGRNLSRGWVLANDSANLLQEIGNFGMCLFFLLSAFLITELLLREQDHSRRIDVRAFYIRRILRIWPLYFAFLGLSYMLGLLDPRDFIIPGRQVAAYLLLAANWYNVYYGFFPASLAILWSISVEEQFYLIWPTLIKMGKGSRGAWAGIILFAIASFCAMYYLGAPSRGNEEAIWMNSFVQFLFFATGGACALAVHKRGIPKLRMSHRLALFCAGFSTFTACEQFLHLRRLGAPLLGWHVPIGYLLLDLGTSLIFLAFLGLSPRYVPEWLRTMGKISYGLYVFHELFLMLTAYWAALLAHAIQAQGTLLTLLKVLVVPVAFALTVTAAWLSYRYFESFFLRLRKRFTIIASRPV